MTQIHLVIRRINPALKIDLVQIGCLSDGQFKELPLSDFEHSPIPCFVQTGSISENPFIHHSDISDLARKLSSFSGYSIDFFDNTIVFTFDFNINPNESAPKEKRKRS